MSAPVQDRRMTLGEHIEELRRCLIKGLIVLALAAAACFCVNDRLMEIATRPLFRVMDRLNIQPRILEISPGEYLMTSMKVSLYAALILSSPFLFYQAWKFVAVGLHAHERRFVLFFGPWIALQFIAGVLFNYFWILPWGVYCFLTYKPEWVVTEWTIAPYISLGLGLSLSFGLVFELPLVMLFLAALRIFSAADFASYRKPAYFGAFVLGAILPPPDPFTQILMAGPIIILYELGIQLSKIRFRTWFQPASTKDVT